mgnify:CR=1 FL=1
MSNRYFNGEFHRSAADNPTHWSNTRHLTNDIGGSMRGILDHSEALPPPKARPRDGGNMRGALNYDVPVEEVPTPRHRVSAPKSTGAEAGRLGLTGASEMSSLLSHGMAPVQQPHRQRNGGSMAALMAGEELPAPAAGSSEAINSKMLLMDMPSSGRARGRPTDGLADPRESAMQRLQLGYREVLKLLQMPASPNMPNPREHDGSITAQAAKGVLATLDACGVHVGPQSAGALLALCDVREQPTWDEFVYALAADQQPSEEPPAAAPPPAALPPSMQPLAALQPDHSIKLSAAQQQQNAWRQQQQQQFEAGLNGGQPQSQSSQGVAQSEWGRPTSRADAKPPCLTPAQVRAEVEAARAGGGGGGGIQGQPGGNWTNSKMVGQEANHDMALLLNGGNAHRHARSSQLSATAQTGTWNSWSR